MSEHHATIHWTPDAQPFTYDTYTRDHAWRFPGAPDVAASAAPEYRGTPERVDPEQAFVAAVSSCHMLTFLAIAAKKRITVLSYRDEAVGVLARNEAGRLAITEVTLRPQIEFEDAPSAEVIDKIHHLSHQECFIANAVNCAIHVEAP